MPTHKGDDKKDTRTIYARGADDGLWLGLCFIALFGLAAASLRMQWLNIAVFAVAVYVPVFTYRKLRRTHVDAHGLSPFSALWMQGIVMFACGALLLGLGSYIYLRYLDPGFIDRVIEYGADFYASYPTESAQEISAEFRSILENDMAPKPQDVVLMWMWGAIFSGSLLSMITAWAVRLRPVPIK